MEEPSLGCRIAKFLELVDQTYQPLWDRALSIVLTKGSFTLAEWNAMANHSSLANQPYIPVS